MLDVLRAEDVRTQDAACAARGIPVARLMENAGFAVAREARRILGGTYGRRVVVACGKGNNGGDGIVAARVLTGWGARATVVLTSRTLSPLAEENLARFDGPVVGLDALAREADRADLVVDALLGVGLSRAPGGAVAEAIDVIARAGVRVLSIDIPSGVDSDTGAIPSVAVRADVTVTFGGLKPGLLFMPGAAQAGRVEVAGIGVPDDLARGVARALERADVAALLPRRVVGDHKRRTGTVLLVAGSRAMPGAATLTAAGCVHGGAGLTILCAPEEVCRVAAARVPEITTIPVPDAGEGTFNMKALDLVRARASEFHAIAIGPGVSTHPAAAEAVRALVAETTVPLVLDADGITALSGRADVLVARRAPVVLTPHSGELSRLTARASADLDADRLGAAIEAARATGSVVLFKGPGTVIAEPGGEAWINTTGSAALSQGGTGDVLTGLIAALVAQAAARDARVTDRAVARAAAVGAWLHGAAADRLSARVGPHPATASTLAAELAPTIHEVAG